MKQFTPKKVVIYGEDGDRVEIDVRHTNVSVSHHVIDNLMDIHIDDIWYQLVNYYVKRTGKRYRKNRRGYR